MGILIVNVHFFLIEYEVIEYLLLSKDDFLILDIRSRRMFNKIYDFFIILMLP
jgi:hypothetical protein